MTWGQRWHGTGWDERRTMLRDAGIEFRVKGGPGKDREVSIPQAVRPYSCCTATVFRYNGNQRGDDMTSSTGSQHRGALISELVARFWDKVLFKNQRMNARDRRIAAVMNG